MIFKIGDTATINKACYEKYYGKARFVTYEDEHGLYLGNYESYIREGVGYFKSFSQWELVSRKNLLTERIKEKNDITIQSCVHDSFW